MRVPIICPVCPTPHEIGFKCDACDHELQENLLLSWGPPSDEQLAAYRANRWKFCPYCGTALYPLQDQDVIIPIYDLGAYG